MCQLEDTLINEYQLFFVEWLPLFDLMVAFSNEVEEKGITLKAAYFNDI